MAFDIVLQVNNSEKNKVSKSLTNILTVSGELKLGSSIIDPVIIINCDLSTVTKCNYMTIGSFGRSYFINNIRSIRSGLVEFSCHVDVLSSFADSIKENTAIIRKQFRVYQNPVVLTKAFPSGFRTQEFVLAVAGSADAGSAAGP